MDEIDLIVQEKERRRKRAAKFGTEFDEAAEVAVPVEDAREKLRLGAPQARRDAAASDMVRDTALHVHGLRFMSSADALELFRGSGASAIEWVNNDSCNIIFDTSFACKRATLALGRLESDASSTMEADAPSSLSKGDALPWHSLKSSSPSSLPPAAELASAGSESPITFRQATIGDRKPVLADVFRVLGKADGPAGQMMKVGTAQGMGFSKRFKPGEESGAVGTNAGPPRGFIQDLDAPEEGHTAGAPLVPLVPPPLLVSTWPQVGAAVEPGEESEALGEVEEDLREKLRRPKDGEDLRERLERRREEEEDSRRGEKEEVQDLREILDRQKRDRRRESIKSRLQEPGTTEGKEPVKDRGRLFLQSISQIHSSQGALT